MKKIEAVAYARKWHVDKEEPYKVRREKDNRIVWHKKFRFMPVTNSKIFPDDEELYTSDALLAVAEAVLSAAYHAVRDSGEYPNASDLPSVDIKAIINQLTGE